MLNSSASHAVVVMTMMTNLDQPPPMKSIVRYANGKTEKFMINGLTDVVEAQRVLCDESEAKVGLILVPKVKHIEHEPDAT